MITPFRHRLGVEIVGGSVRAVLTEWTPDGASVLDSIERENTGGDERSEDTTLDLLEAVAGMVPNRGEAIPVSLVLPADRVIDTVIQVPVDMNVPIDDWEEWELSTHLTGAPENYWYESRHEKDSVCGRFHVRRILATRKEFVGRVFKIAANLSLFIDELHFPQTLLGGILSAYHSADDSACFESIYLANRLSCFVRTRAGVVTDMSLLPSPPEANARRLVETVETLLSWHGGQPSSGSRRIIIDGGGSGEIASTLVSKLGFTKFNARPISQLLDGSIDRPEHFLLPLGALGVI